MYLFISFLSFFFSFQSCLSLSLYQFSSNPATVSKATCKHVINNIQPQMTDIVRYHEYIFQRSSNSALTIHCDRRSGKRDGVEEGFGVFYEIAIYKGIKE